MYNRILSISFEKLDDYRLNLAPSFIKYYTIIIPFYTIFLPYIFNRNFEDIDSDLVNIICLLKPYS